MYYEYFYFLRSFFVGFFLHYYTMILQRIRIFKGDDEFEPGTSTPEATYEPPPLHHHLEYYQFSLFISAFLVAHLDITSSLFLSVHFL